MDSSPETGGQDFGIRPMQMLLMGLGGCSGIDIVSILKKQRQTVGSFRMIIDGEREKGKDPTLWETVHITFELKGQIDPDKAKKACELSIDKYCSVAATLREAHCKVTWSVRVNQ
jgi:putative redox protein